MVTAGLARAVPDGDLGGEFDAAGGAVIPGHGGDRPDRLVLIQDGFERGTPCAFQSRPSVLTRLAGWRWGVEGGVQAQSGNEDHRLTQGLAAVQEIKHGVAVVAHQHNGPVGEPAAQQHDHLTSPVGDLLVPASLPLVVARGGRQHREHRQGPMASRPRHLAQPHQGDPARTTGLDQLVATGTHRVPVNAPGPDLGAPTPLQSFLNAEDQRTVAAIQVLELQQEQDTRRLTRRPHRTVQRLVVAGVVALVAASHDPQRRRHGALTRGQDRAHQQELGTSAKSGW